MESRFPRVLPAKVGSALRIGVRSVRRWACALHCAAQLRHPRRVPRRRAPITNALDGRSMAFEYPNSDSERLLELVVRLSAKLDQPMLWEDIVCSATSLLRSERGALLVAEEEEAPRVVATVGLGEVHHLLLERISSIGWEWLVRSGAGPVAAHDLNAYPFAIGWDRGLGNGIGSAIYLPLTGAEGKLLAILVAFYPAPRDYSEREARLLPQLALVLGPLVSNALAQSSALRYAAAARRRARKLHYLAEACAALSLAGGGAAALKRAVSLATSWMADRCVIEVVDEASDLAATYAVCRLGGEWCEVREAPVPDPQRRSWLEKLLRTAEPVLLQGLTPDHPAVPALDCCGNSWKPDAGLSLLSLALRRQGRVIGAMTMIRQESGAPAYDRDDIALAAEIVRHTELALDYERARNGRAGRQALVRAQG